MKSLAFASRNLKEIIRDPLMMSFCIGFPVIVLLLLSAIQANIPVSLFAIDSLTPGIAVFGLSFISLFAGTLLAKDRSTSFLMRLFATPLKASDFIFGYVLPVFPIALLQCVVCFGLAIILGLPLSIHILMALVALIPTMLLFIGCGLLMGSIFNDKAVGGISSILVNVAAWLSGAWFDLNLVGGVFKKIGYLLPFAPAVDAARSALAGDYAAMFPNLWWVIGYAVVTLGLAIVVFRRKMAAGSN